MATVVVPTEDSSRLYVHAVFSSPASSLEQKHSLELAFWPMWHLCFALNHLRPISAIFVIFVSLILPHLSSQFLSLDFIFSRY